MGIRGKAYELIKSYLSDRKQAVKVNGVKSSYASVNIGVSQGSILGPLLFILYINNVIEHMPENSVVCYADDTAVISVEVTWTKAVVKMNEYLSTIADLLALNKLSLNKQKTVYMTFGNYVDSVPVKATIKINETEIQRLNNTNI